MPKKIFAVLLDKPDVRVKERLDKHYANIHQHTQTFLLVPVEASVSTLDVAKHAGIKGENRDVTGVVFKLNAAYSGYTKKDLWEWLSSFMVTKRWAAPKFDMTCLTR